MRTTIATFVEDFLAEAPEQVAANIALRAGLEGVSIAAAHHAGRDVFPQGWIQEALAQARGHRH